MGCTNSKSAVVQQGTHAPANAPAASSSPPNIDKASTSTTAAEAAAKGNAADNAATSPSDVPPSKATTPPPAQPATTVPAATPATAPPTTSTTKSAQQPHGADAAPQGAAVQPSMVEVDVGGTGPVAVPAPLPQQGQVHPGAAAVATTVPASGAHVHAGANGVVPQPEYPQVPALANFSRLTTSDV